MSDHRQWQRETALRRIQRAMDDDPGQPVERLFKGAADYVGATEADVRAWWRAR